LGEIYLLISVPTEKLENTKVPSKKTIKQNKKQSNNEANKQNKIINK